MVLFADLPYDGKAEPRAAGGLAAALIDAIETLENARLMRLRDADAGVPHGQHMMVHTHRNGAIVAVVADRVIDKIVDQLGKQRAVAGDDRGFPGQRDRRVLPHGGGLERLDILLRQLIKIDLLGFGHDLRFVQLGQLDDIGDELEHALGFTVDARGELLDVLLLGHAGFDHFGVAGNRGQRRFQLMRNVRRKLLLAAVVHVREVEDRAAALPAGDTVVIQQLHRMAVQLKNFRVAVARGTKERRNPVVQIIGMRFVPQMEIVVGDLVGVQNPAVQIADHDAVRQRFHNLTEDLRIAHVLLSETVADVADRDDQLARGAELLPQRLDVHIDGARFARKRKAPNGVHQAAACHDGALVLKQELQ